MELGELKPLVGALVLPPGGPLLLALLGVALAWRRRGLGLALATFGLVLGFALSTNAVAVRLTPHLLAPTAAVAPQQLRDVQAIVVLGGGVVPQAPEYGSAQPTAPTLVRLRYAAWLARRSGKPLGFAGGVGWGAVGTGVDAEGTVARRALQEDYGLSLRWVDDASRDTHENAQRMAALMRPDAIRRIALVTEAAHMPRAAREFRAAGFEVLPAPTGFPVPLGRDLLEWLPSGAGADANRALVREWLRGWTQRPG